MNGKTFLDSNVLVYSVDESPAEKAKHERAIELLSAYPEDLVVSTQVLQEFYVVTTRKLKTPLTEERAARAVRGLAKLDVIGVDAPLVLAAVDTSRLVQLSFWDALIIEAASRAGCERVLSEDLNAGQVIHGVRIENPFADLKPVAIEGRSDLAEPLCAQLAPVGKLIAAIPAPRGDHRQHEDPALAQQVPIDTRIVLADFFGRMGEVEFDRPTATRLEVYEQQPVLRGENVARVRLAVQQLLGAVVPADHSPQASQRVAQQLSVRVGERRSAVAAPDELLSLLDSIREAGRRDIELAHANVQPLERTGVVGWWELSRCRRFVVGPQRQHEAIRLIDTWVHSGLKSSHRAPGFGEPLSKLDFELRDLIRYRRHPGQHVTRQQTQGELVRVVQNDRVVDGQVK